MREQALRRFLYSRVHAPDPPAGAGSPVPRGGQRRGWVAADSGDNIRTDADDILDDL